MSLPPHRDCWVGPRLSLIIRWRDAAAAFFTFDRWPRDTALHVATAQRSPVPPPAVAPSACGLSRRRRGAYAPRTGGIASRTAAWTVVLLKVAAVGITAGDMPCQSRSGCPHMDFEP